MSFLHRFVLLVPFSSLLAASVLFPPPASAQSSDLDDGGRAVAAGTAGLSLGLGTLALSLHLARGDDLWSAAAVTVSVAVAVGGGALAYFVPQEESGAMAITFLSALGGAAVFMVGWVAMSGTLEDEEVIAAVATPLLVGPVLGIALAALLGALDGPSEDVGMPAPAGLTPRFVVPITGSF